MPPKAAARLPLGAADPNVLRPATTAENPAGKAAPKTRKRKSDTEVEAGSNSKPTAKKAKTTAPTNNTGNNNQIAAAPKSTKKTIKAKADPLDVTGIVLDDESEDGVRTVPVYDTCDTVRRKIRALLRKDGVTQAAFCRAAAAAAFGPGEKLNAASLAAFLRKKGPSEGNTSGAFYAGYVLCEKIRIRDGKPKSADREEMEEIWPNGMEINELRKWFICHRDSKLVTDKYGRIFGVPA